MIFDETGFPYKNTQEVLAPMQEPSIITKYSDFLDWNPPRTEPANEISKDGLNDPFKVDAGNQFIISSPGPHLDGLQAKELQSDLPKVSNTIHFIRTHNR